jgi:hypothetical protein
MWMRGADQQKAHVPSMTERGLDGGAVDGDSSFRMRRFEQTSERLHEGYM